MSDREALARPDAGDSPAWPNCPRCGRPRLAVCPVCGTAGHDFPRGDPFSSDPNPPDDSTSPGAGPAAQPAPSIADHNEVELLICPTCDEPFEPGFLRYCEWCGHDFGGGVEAAAPELGEVLTGRTLALMLALATAVIAIMLYFNLLLRR